jgi:hypothetical protein
VNRAFEIAATRIEARFGMNCTGCGKQHATSPDEVFASDRCSCCPSCQQLWGEQFAKEHPHIVGTASRITPEMVEQAIQELRAKSEEIERRLGPTVLSSFGLEED